MVFDFDGTILEGHSPVSLTYALLRKRVLSVGAGLKVGLWGLRYKLRLPAEQSVVRKRIFRSLAHLPAQEVNQMMADLYTAQLAPRLRPAALAAIEQHRQNGEKVILVSASFRPLLEQAAAVVGAYHVICTEMEVVDGYYSGNVVGQPPEGEQKLIQLTAFANECFGANNWVLTSMYGDHHSDEYLMDVAQHPVAVNPDLRLARDAKAKGWQIVDWEFTPGN
ncbi:MAG: HAD-IB family hydrolase [Coriobacteriales bacterium]|nr:HAD-IB family hydrolase [Coriobacteriales bacterium]